jgi:hypothetical protein
VTNANDILMGSGAPAAKFEQIGVTVTGTVLREPEARQQTEFRTGTPEVWKDGSPKMQVVVQLATTDHPQHADDDGTRTLYIKGKHLTDAIRQAVRASGANGIHTGGTLTVQYIADGPAEAGLNPPKLYAAQYQPPAASFTGVTAPATGQQPVVQPPTAAVQQVPAAPPGVNPEMWVRMAPDQQQRVLAAMLPAGQPAGAQQFPY